MNGPSGNMKLKEGKLLNGEVVDIRDLERRTNFRRYVLVVSSVLLIDVIIVLCLRLLNYNVDLFGLISLVILTIFFLAVSFSPLFSYQEKIVKKTNEEVK